MSRSIFRNYLLILILITSISACTAGATINNNLPAPNIPISGAPSSGMCANYLYPVIQGTSWVYASTGSPAGPFTYVDTITEIHTNGFTLTSQFKDLTRAQEWTCKPEGLLATQLGGGITTDISAQGLLAQFKTSNITGISLPLDIQNTQQWAQTMDITGNVAMPDNQAAQGDGSANSTFQVLGTEPVNVPAGAFDAVKIQVNTIFAVNTSFQGFSVPLNFSSTTIMWYAPYVGWVKSVTNSDFGGSPYSSTTELQSYNFP